MKTTRLSQKKKIALFCASSILMLSSLYLTAAELTAPKAVFQGSGAISPVLKFNQPESGDIYLAFRKDGVGDYFFLASNGSASPTATAYQTVSSYTGTLNLPSFDTSNIATGQYQLFHLLVKTGGDVNKTSDWVGGFNALKTINFSIGFSGAQSGDLDGDGFRDDDLNKDGFSDNDGDHDGYHDDDLDKNGIVGNEASTASTTIGSGTSTTTTTTTRLSTGMETARGMS